MSNKKIYILIIFAILANLLPTYSQSIDLNYWTFIERNDWVLIQINGRLLESEPQATVKFDLQKMSVSGFTGCNSFFGSFNSSADSISFSRLGMTRMACPGVGGTLEQEFVQLLSGENLRFDLAESVLNIYSGDSLVLMFAAQNNKKAGETLLTSKSQVQKHLNLLTSNTWNLLEINGIALSGEVKAIINFEL